MRLLHQFLYMQGGSQCTFHGTAPNLSTNPPCSCCCSFPPAAPCLLLLLPRCLRCSSFSFRCLPCPLPMPPSLQVAANASLRTAVVSSMSGLFLLDYSNEAAPGAGQSPSQLFLIVLLHCCHVYVIGGLPFAALALLFGGICCLWAAASSCMRRRQVGHRCLCAAQVLEALISWSLAHHCSSYLNRPAQQLQDAQVELRNCVPTNLPSNPQAT